MRDVKIWRSKILWLWLVVTALAMTKSAVWAGENICSLENARKIGQKSFSMEVKLSNCDTLAALQVPFGFSYGNIDIRCDSISFAGGACEDFSYLDTKIDNENKRVYLAAVYQVYPDDDCPPLFPGNHLLAKVFFTVDRISLDQSATFKHDAIPHPYINYSFQLWTLTAEEAVASLRFEKIELR